MNEFSFINFLPKIPSFSFILLWWSQEYILNLFFLLLQTVLMSLMIHMKTISFSRLVNWVLWHINLCRLFNAKSIFIQISKSKVGDHSRGRPEGSLFNSYYTEVLGRVLLLSLGCSTLPLIYTLYRWVLSKAVSSSIFKVFGMTRLGIEPRSPGPWANTLPTRLMSWLVLFQTIHFSMSTQFVKNISISSYSV